jgi:propanol-preferring alcohol dehydrogenase
LLRPGSTAVVIGLGGLGQFAVAILRVMTPASVIAVDAKETAIDAVRDRVDHAFLATSPDLAGRILAAAGGHGPDVVLDFVGTTGTLALAGSVVAPYGAIRVPGQSGGVLPFETDRATTVLPRGATIDRPYGGTRQDLLDLVSLARTGRLETRITRYRFEDTLKAFDDLGDGKITGRAVVVME